MAQKRLFDRAYSNYHGRLNQYDWGVPYPLCTIVPAGDNDAKACTDLCVKGVNGKRNKKCNSVNVIPWKIPSSSFFKGEINPMIPKQCRGMKVPDDARICYALKEGKATDAGSAFTISSDPDG